MSSDLWTILCILGCLALTVILIFLLLLINSGKKTSGRKSGGLPVLKKQKKNRRTDPGDRTGSRYVAGENAGAF